MTKKYVIHPAIGVARVGNHPTDFYLAPTEIGGLPLECDTNGNETGETVTSFKSHSVGHAQIRRQGQKFCVYEYDSDLGKDQTPKKLVIGTAGANELAVTSIKWTVHLANKKSVWYEYSELEGNLLLGSNNSYTSQGVPLRNRCWTGDRNQLLINPGSKDIEGAEQTLSINGGSFPQPSDFNSALAWDNNLQTCSVKVGERQGDVFTELGDLKTDSQGNLVVLGGHGKSWGRTDLAGYGGGDYWFDDISDGSVTCEITLSGQGTPLPEKPTAWVIVGPPDFAPEIVNISAWDDTSFDVAVRELGLVPEMYNGTWNCEFVADYERDILPIINRLSGYHWVANVQSMMAFSSNIFDFSDPSAATQAQREVYYNYFRDPDTQQAVTNTSPPPPYSAPSVQTTLFSGDTNGAGPHTGLPRMPLNSGSNSVSEANIKKFLALTETQHFLLGQWKDGKFASSHSSSTLTPTVSKYPLIDSDRASIGNVVGLPQCPGIEVTWTTQNKAIYEKVAISTSDGPLYQLQIKHAPDLLFQDLTRDECEATNASCEPGDLTKRMAVPWQADFFNCTIQLVNYTDPNVNKINGVPKRPTYYAYWWPPQAPWDVINGLNTRFESEPDPESIQRRSKDSEMAGLQMNYARGLNSYSQMVNHGWAALGFIRNVGDSTEIGDSGVKSSELFPYFVETERNYEDFEYQEFTVEELTTVIPNFLAPSSLQDKRKARIHKLMQRLQESDQRQTLTPELLQMAGKTTATEPDELQASLQSSLESIENFREIKVTRKPGEIPRSGRRIRF